MGRTVKEHAQMMKYLTRPRDVFPDPSSMDQASLAEELEPGSLKDEMLKDFDPSQETYEEYLQRKNLVRPFNMAEGGQMVKPSVDGSRPGYGGTRPADAEFKNKTIPKYAKELETWVKKNIKNYKNLKDIDKMYNDAVKHFSKEPYANQKFGKNFLSESTIKASRLKGGEKVFTFRLGDYAYGDIFKLGEQTSDATSKVRYVKDMMTIELINNNPKLKKIFTDYYNGKPINDNDMRIISRFNKEYLKGGTSKRPNLLRAWFQKLNPDFEKIRQDVAVFQDAISKQIATQRDNTNLSSPMRKKYKEAYTALRRMSSTFRTNFVKEFPKTVSKKAMDFHGNQIAKELFQWEHKAPRVTRDITNLPASYLARITQTPGTFNVFKMRYFDEPLDNLILKYELAKPNKRKGIEKEIKTLYKNFNTKSGGYLKPLKISFNETTGKINLKDTTPILKPTDYQTYKKQVAKNIIHADTYYKNIGEKKYRYDKNTIKSLLKELCPRGGSASGGRIGFKFGSGANCGKKHMSNLLENGTGTDKERNLIKRIISGGNTILKNTGKFVAGILNPLDFFRLKNLIGLPAAIAAVGFDTVAIADDVLRKNQPLDVAAGNEFLTQFLDLNTESKQAQRILDDKGSNLSPAAKEYAQLLVDWGKYKNILKEKNDISRAGNLETFEEDQAKLEKKLNILQEKISNTRTDGMFDYQSVVNELGINEEQSEYIGEAKKSKIPGYYYAADDTNTIPKYPFLTEDMGTGQSRSDGFYRNADGNRIKVNEYGYATKGNIFDIPGKTGARVDRKFPYGETDQGRNPALLTEGEKIFRAETKQPAKYQKPFTYKDFNYQNKALSDEQYNKVLKYYRDQGFIKDDQRLEDVNIPKGYNKRIVNGKEYDPPKTFLQDVTEYFNIDDKWKQAIYQPGMLGTQDKFAIGGRAGYSEGGITGLRSKYEYKK